MGPLLQCSVQAWRPILVIAQARYIQIRFRTFTAFRLDEQAHAYYTEERLRLLTLKTRASLLCLPPPFRAHSTAPVHQVRLL